MVAMDSGADNGFFYAGQVMHFSSPFTVFLIYHKHFRGYSMNNIGFWSCIILSIPFAFVGILFAAFKDKAAKYVSGFNSLPKKEQELYDKARISRDIRNQCFTWSVIMLIGSVLSFFITPSMAIPAYIIWLVLFFKDVHFDSRKAFEKYLIK